MSDHQFQPFENIGLCFSGGGYRATFFALGVVSYLDLISYKNESLLKNRTFFQLQSGQNFRILQIFQICFLGVVRNAKRYIKLLGLMGNFLFPY